MVPAFVSFVYGINACYNRSTEEELGNILYHKEYFMMNPIAFGFNNDHHCLIRLSKIHEFSGANPFRDASPMRSQCNFHFNSNETKLTRFAFWNFQPQHKKPSVPRVLLHFASAQCTTTWPSGIMADSSSGPFRYLYTFHMADGWIVASWGATTAAAQQQLK